MAHTFVSVEAIKFNRVIICGLLLLLMTNPFM